MAIDGVKIIDSDSACDIYNNITERYKDGEDIEKIRQDWLNEEANFCIDELFAEIYWTAFAYALWKIGYPHDEVRMGNLEMDLILASYRGEAILTTTNSKTDQPKDKWGHLPNR